MKRKVLNVKKINSLGWYNKISANKGLKITTLKYFNNIKIIYKFINNLILFNF